MIETSRAESLILVDEQDRVVGYEHKGECHAGRGLRHRAFSAFIFHENGRLLLQRRAEAKPLWPGYWSNSCCSHPRKGEATEAAVHRRLVEELGLTAAPLEFLFKFNYHASYRDIGAERELCHVYFGRMEGAANPNPDEIAEIRFVDVAQLDRELKATPQRFTPWFLLEWRIIRKAHGPRLRSFAEALV